jgi:hypothetical protein
MAEGYKHALPIISLHLAGVSSLSGAVILIGNKQAGTARHSTVLPLEHDTMPVS